eukprot:sb/3475418/
MQNQLSITMNWRASNATTPRNILAYFQIHQYDNLYNNLLQPLEIYWHISKSNPITSDMQGTRPTIVGMNTTATVYSTINITENTPDDQTVSGWCVWSRSDSEGTKPPFIGMGSSTFYLLRKGSPQKV